jgi:gas vesicle protein
MTHHESAGANLLVAFALGAVAGAAIALLYAPAPGDETRRRLAERAREGRQRAESMVRDGREFINRQRDHVKAAVERGREAYDEAYNEARKESL